VTFRTLTLADALVVTSAMRKVDIACLETVGFFTNPEQVALYHWNGEGAAWTQLDDEGAPVAIGGVRLITPWNGLVWMVCTERMSPCLWKKTIRHGRIVLENASKRLRRVECHVLGTWPEALPFAQRMGFSVEGVRQGAGRDGEDILTMVYRGNHGD
jgi:hypothetical protein